MPSIPVSQKKRGRPATGETPRIGVRMDPELIRAVERFRAEHLPPIESQSDAIRRLLRDHLTGLGYLKPDE